MNPLIVFLGTGGDTNVIGKQTLGSGGIVIQTEDNQFHLDPGPGATVRARMYNINIRQTTAILLSSGYLLQSNDVNAVISAMTHDGLDQKGVLIAPESAMNGLEGIDPSVKPKYKEMVEKAIVARRDQRIGIDTTEIQVIPTKHTDTSAIGYKLYTPNFVLAYSANTNYDKEAIEQYKNVDILILNVPYPAGTKKRDGLSSDDAIKILKQTKPSLGILTHFGNKMVQADILQETRRVQQESGVQVIAAKDGTKINPANYSSQLKTKTLNLFKS